MPTPISLPTNYQRLDPFPLDVTSVFSSLSSLTAYADTNPTAYPGQIVAVSGNNTGYIIKTDKTVTALGAGSFDGTTLKGVVSADGPFLIGSNTIPVTGNLLVIKGGNVRIDGVDLTTPGTTNYTPFSALSSFNTDGQSIFDLRSESVSANYNLSISNSGFPPSNFMKFFGGRGGDPNPFIVIKTGTPLRFASYSDFWNRNSDFTEYMRIDTATGNVGIGTQTPGAKLVVQGTVSASQFVGPGITGNSSSASFQRLSASYTTSLGTGSAVNFNSVSLNKGIAQGHASTAEGFMTFATGSASHTEGFNTATCKPLQFNQYTSSVKAILVNPVSPPNEANWIASLVPGSYVAGFGSDTSNPYQYIPFVGKVASIQDNGGGSSWYVIFEQDVFGRDVDYGFVYPISGHYAHAEGLQTVAQGDSSHAEGNNTFAIGTGSHAEGQGTWALGAYSHAEGGGTYAVGLRAHAEGSATEARGLDSHAEGWETLAIGIQSHAEGRGSQAIGWRSHAAGFRAAAAQDYTYAWTDGDLGTITRAISTTRTGQYMVSASGGVFIPGNVGIGTDDNNNALTVNGAISAANITAQNITVTSGLSTSVSITNLTATKTFLSSDTCRVFHFDTTSQPLCAVFPSELPNGFNVALMNTGTNNLRLSAAQLNAVGVTIGIKYGGAFVYKDNNQLFAVGRL